MPFNLGWSEIIMVLILALVFVGPKKLPELAAGLGKMIREFRKTTAGIKDEIQLEEHIRKPLQDLKDAVTLPADELRRRDEWEKERKKWEKEEEERKAREGDGEHQVQGDGEHDNEHAYQGDHDPHYDNGVDEGEHAPDLAARGDNAAGPDSTIADGAADKTSSDRTQASEAPAPTESMADKTIAMQAPNFGTPRPPAMRKPTPPPPSPLAAGLPGQKKDTGSGPSASRALPRVAPAGTVASPARTVMGVGPKPVSATAVSPIPQANVPVSTTPMGSPLPAPAVPAPTLVPPPPPAASRLPPPRVTATKVPAPDEEKA